MITLNEWDIIKNEIGTGIYSTEIWKKYLSILLKREVSEDEVYQIVYQINKERLRETGQKS